MQGKRGIQIASSSVSTCLIPASSASTSSQRPMASRMLVRASSLVSPWEWQPGRSRQLTDQPSSVSSKQSPYHTAGSSLFLEPSRHQAHRARVSRQLLIRGDQQQPLRAGLGDQQAIKGIAMQRRQGRHRQGVMGLDR